VRGGLGLESAHLPLAFGFRVGSACAPTTTILCLRLMPLLSDQRPFHERLKKNRCFQGRKLGLQHDLVIGARARSAGGARLRSRSSLCYFALAARCREDLEGGRVGLSDAASDLRAVEQPDETPRWPKPLSNIPLLMGVYWSSVMSRHFFLSRLRLWVASIKFFFELWPVGTAVEHLWHQISGGRGVVKIAYSLRRFDNQADGAARAARRRGQGPQHQGGSGHLFRPQGGSL
jgi:hypothetical protein